MALIKGGGEIKRGFLLGIGITVAGMLIAWAWAKWGNKLPTVG